jgi:hypothetical protein
MFAELLVMLHHQVIEKSAKVLLYITLLYPMQIIPAYIYALSDSTAANNVK